MRMNAGISDMWMAKSTLWLEQNVGLPKSRLNVMRNIKNCVVSINHLCQRGENGNTNAIQMVHGMGYVLDVVGSMNWLKPTIVLIAVMNTSLGMAQHSNKFNT